MRMKKKTVLSILVCTYLSCITAVQAEDPGVNYLLNTTAQQVQQAAPTKSARTHLVQRESIANSMPIPNPILSTGCDITSPYISPNAQKLAEQLHISAQLSALYRPNAAESSDEIGERLSYFEAREHVSEVLRGAEMDVNYVLAELYDEQATYNELLSAYSAERDKIIAKTNAVSFATNGGLWALCEGLSIPTVSRAGFAVPSGITGILAGIIPSIASALTLKQLAGKNYSAPAAPNMLSQLFNRETSPELNYPPVVWDFLNDTPADNPQKKRKDILVDRWVMDSNIPVLTDRQSTKQINAVTGSTDQNKSLNISILSARIAMLQQLSCEVFKMNRLLDELEMALRGLKQPETALASSRHNTAE